MRVEQAAALRNGHLTLRFQDGISRESGDNGLDLTNLTIDTEPAALKPAERVR